MAGLKMALLVFCALLSLAAGHGKKALQTKYPFNIAHRGWSGFYPEETEAAYKAAIKAGADFIETDIMSTKDGVLVCFHDWVLDATTDVASHPEFASKMSTKLVEDLNGAVNLTGYFVADFTWAELKTLRTNMRQSFRNPSFNGQFPIITFEHYLQIALNASRVVGVYPELKSPVHVNRYVKFSGGRTFEQVFVSTLLKYGYGGLYKSASWRKQPLFIQSFAPSYLVKMASLIKAPLVFLVDEMAAKTQDTLESFDLITSDAYLKALKMKTKGYLSGLGPWKDTADGLGILMPTSYRSLPPTGSERKTAAGKGVTFAIEGTTILGDSSNIRTLAYQLELLTTLRNNGNITDSRFSKGVVFVSAGVNDFYQYFFTPDPKPYDITTLIGTLIYTLDSTITALNRLGTQRLLLASLASGDCLPAFPPVGAVNGTCVPWFRELIDGYNGGLAAMAANAAQKWPGTKVVIVDLTKAMRAIHANPATYGFTEVKSACCEGLNQNPFETWCGRMANNTKLYTLCEEPSKYLFWDPIHPTQQGFKKVADLFINGVNYTSPGPNLKKVLFYDDK